MVGIGGSTNDHQGSGCPSTSFGSVIVALLEPLPPQKRPSMPQKRPSLHMHTTYRALLSLGACSLGSGVHSVRNRRRASQGMARTGSQRMLQFLLDGAGATFGDREVCSIQSEWAIKRKGAKSCPSQWAQARKGARVPDSGVRGLPPGERYLRVPGKQSSG